MNVVDYTLADATFLNQLKHKIRAVIAELDNHPKVYPECLEAHEVEHALSVLLSEAKVHGLWKGATNE